MCPGWEHSRLPTGGVAGAGGRDEDPAIQGITALQFAPVLQRAWARAVIHEQDQPARHRSPLPGGDILQVDRNLTVLRGRPDWGDHRLLRNHPASTCTSMVSRRPSLASVIAAAILSKAHMPERRVHKPWGINDADDMRLCRRTLVGSGPGACKPSRQTRNRSLAASWRRGTTDERAGKKRRRAELR